MKNVETKSLTGSQCIENLICMRRILISDVRRLTHAALVKSGASEQGAVVIAKTVSDAEIDGSHSHGLFRVPGYCRALKEGVASCSEPIIEDVRPGMVRVDACGGFAPLALDKVRPVLIQKARDCGVACASIRNSFHFAALWHEVEYLAEAGLIGFAFVNSNSFVAHYGGTSKLYGTNPMAFAFPRPSPHPPVVFDQASAAMARGEIMLAQRDGHSIPEGVAVDAYGQPTTDPTKALEGAQLTFGKYKGTTIALMVELMAAALTGSPFAFQAREIAGCNDSGLPTKHGEFLMAIDPSAAHPGCAEGFAQHAEELFARLNSEGSHIRLPGERRHKRRQQIEAAGDAAATGVPVQLLEEVIRIAGVTLPFEPLEHTNETLQKRSNI